MTVQLRPALLGPLLAVVVLHVVTRASGIAWLALASAAALALPVTSLVLRPRLDRLQVQVVQPRRVAAGDRVEVELRVRNAGRTAAPACTWSCDHPGLGGLEAAVPALDAGREVRVQVEARAERRGVHHLGPAVLASTAPYGLLRWSCEVATGAHPLVVHPVTGAVRALRAEGSPTAADRSLPVAGAGTEVLGLRPWRQGDALRHLSARASARHGRPVVLERERESGPSLVVLAVGGGQGPVWEHAVSAAASLALAALREGRPPVLLADPPPARLDAVGVLDFFASVDEAGPPRPVDVQAAVRAAGRGGTLVLLAPPGAFEHTMAVRRAASAGGVRVEVLGA